MVYTNERQEWIHHRHGLQLFLSHHGSFSAPPHKRLFPAASKTNLMREIFQVRYEIVANRFGNARLHLEECGINSSFEGFSFACSFAGKCAIYVMWNREDHAKQKMVGLNRHSCHAEMMVNEHSDKLRPFCGKWLF